jgi:3-(3-hydroxy-phenyl)propionate hydroxylase
MTRQQRIIVAGAGPVGVVTALACAQRGFAVTLLEAEKEVDCSPRAATTHPSTLEMIASLGIIDEFIAAGLVARYFDFWDQARHELVARFDHDMLRERTDFPFVVQTEQHKLVNIGLRKLAQYPDVDVRFGAAVLELEQDAQRVSVTVESDGRAERISGAFLVGADGGRSTVRKKLDIEFEGYTWPERFLVLTTSFDFEKAIGCSYRSYLADPVEWGNLFKIAGDDMKGRWRAVFPAPVDVADEAVMSDEEAQRRLNRILDLGGETYPLLHRNLYRVHQRVAKSFRLNRVFLAGDASHVNNPIGGLGLNCGIHDALELADTFAQCADGNADAPVLDRYERRRRTLNIEFVQQQTVANKKRLEEKDPAERQRHLADLAATAGDPERHRAFLMRTSLLQSVIQAKAID